LRKLEDPSGKAHIRRKSLGGEKKYSYIEMGHKEGMEGKRKSY